VLADWNERYRDDCGELQRQIDSGELTWRAIKLKPAELRRVLLRGLRTDDTWTFRHYEWRIGDGIDPDRYLWRWRWQRTSARRQRPDDWRTPLADRHQREASALRTPPLRPPSA